MIEPLSLMYYWNHYTSPIIRPGVVPTLMAVCIFMVSLIAILYPYSRMFDYTMNLCDNIKSYLIVGAYISIVHEMCSFSEQYINDDSFIIVVTQSVYALWIMLGVMDYRYVGKYVCLYVYRAVRVYFAKHKRQNNTLFLNTYHCLSPHASIDDDPWKRIMTSFLDQSSITSWSHTNTSNYTILHTRHETCPSELVWLYYERYNLTNVMNFIHKFCVYCGFQPIISGKFLNECVEFQTCNMLYPIEIWFNDRAEHFFDGLNVKSVIHNFFVKSGYYTQLSSKGYQFGHYTILHTTLYCDGKPSIVIHYTAKTIDSYTFDGLFITSPSGKRYL